MNRSLAPHPAETLPSLSSLQAFPRYLDAVAAQGQALRETERPCLDGTMARCLRLILNWREGSAGPLRQWNHRRVDSAKKMAKQRSDARSARLLPRRGNLAAAGGALHEPAAFAPQLTGLAAHCVTLDVPAGKAHGHRLR